MDTCTHPNCVLISVNTTNNEVTDTVGIHVHGDDGETTLQLLDAASNELRSQLDERFGVNT